MKAFLLKAAVPVLCVTAGVGAWAALRPTTSAFEPAAWIDAPLAGSVVAPGNVQVQLHASGSGGVDQIELSIDGERLATAAGVGDDRLVRASITWPARPGAHTLAVRAHGENGWGSSGPPIVVVVQDPRQPPEPDDERSDTTATPSAITTTPNSGMVTSTSVPIDDASPSTSVTPTTDRPGPAHAPGAPPVPSPTPTTPATPPPTRPRPPLSPPAVAASSDVAFQGDPVRLSAVSDYSGRFTIRLEVRLSSSGPYEALPGSCSGSPCRIEHTFARTGRYQFRATLITADGRSVSSAPGTIQIRANAS